MANGKYIEGLLSINVISAKITEAPCKFAKKRCLSRRQRLSELKELSISIKYHKHVETYAFAQKISMLSKLFKSGINLYQPGEKAAEPHPLVFRLELH